MAASRWTDLLNPDEEELRRELPRDFQPDDLLELLRAPTVEADEVRPTLRPRGSYVFGVLLVAVAVRDEDRVFYQEVDLVVMPGRMLTVRKTPPGEQPFDPRRVLEVCDLRGEDLPPGEIAYHLVDEVAERFLDLLDDVDEEIDELEEHIDHWRPERTRRRLSELRHDLLHIRQTLAPTRDAVRAVVDGRVDIEGRALFTREVFPADVERQFASAYDKLLRANESLELSRDLLAAARDYHQSKIANDQNEVMKTLTAIASILLFPTFVVGVYGQNFDHMPELHWYLGYLFSWGVIVLATVLQIVYFRRKRWI
jgi:magnesium transporter